MMMVQGLNDLEAKAEVLVNNERVGWLKPTYIKVGTNDYPIQGWKTQILNIGQQVLKDGENDLEIMPALHDSADPTDHYDEFAVRDVVCYFKEDVANA